MSKVEQIANELSSLTVMEAADLAKHLEEKWGVSAAAPVAAAAAPVASAAPAQQTEFDVILVAAGDKKIEVIKVVRELLGLGLKEAKDFAETANNLVKKAVTKAEADKIKDQFEKAGAKIDIK